MLIDFPTLADLPGGPVVALLVGLALVVAGRRLFWLAIGVLGFLVGFELAGSLVDAGSETAALVVGLLGGVTGVLLAVFLQKVAIAFGGFMAGGFLAVSLFGGLVEPGGLGEPLLFLVGGLVVAFLALALFEWALILISVVAGGYLLVDALTLDPTLELVIFLVALVAGIAIQLGLGDGGRRRRRRRLAS
jgi:hypothetical protein